MKDYDPISSHQALDNYFDELLDDTSFQFQPSVSEKILSPKPNNTNTKTYQRQLESTDIDVFSLQNLLTQFEQSQEIEIKNELDIQTDLELTEDPKELEKLEDANIDDSSFVWRQIEKQDQIQLLFFELFSMTYAVPLTELGNIHKFAACTKLLGRPKWYMGLQSDRDINLDVIDLIKWVMPENISDDQHQEKYDYIITLGQSSWGIACEKLHGIETQSYNQIQWREIPGKRPWLSGIVKDKKCVLLHVEALIDMLNKGINTNS